MNEIVTCQFVNKGETHKNEQMILCTEWLNFGCNIFIFGPESPLNGKLSLSEINKFVNECPKKIDIDEYMTEIKDIFSGNDKDIEFFLEKNHFRWRKKVWNHGSVQVNHVSDMNILTDLLKVILGSYKNLQINGNKLGTENVHLKNYQIKLQKKLEDMVDIKESMETELYKKFLMILNAKKKKIRELTNRSTNEPDNKQSVYDLDTDSGDDCETNNVGKHNIYKKDTGKRNFDKSSIINESQPKKQKSTKEDKTTDSNLSENTDDTYFLNNSVEQVSKEYLENKSVNVIGQSSKDSISLSCEENDCEIDLKLTDDSSESIGPSTSAVKSNFIEAESDEDLFSQ